MGQLTPLGHRSVQAMSRRDVEVELTAEAAAVNTWLGVPGAGVLQARRSAPTGLKAWQEAALERETARAGREAEEARRAEEARWQDVEAKFPGFRQWRRAQPEPADAATS